MNKKSLVSAVLALLPYCAFAGGEAVNCRAEVVGEQPIYGGKPQCDANYNVTTCTPHSNGHILTTRTYSEPLSGNYRESERNYVWLRGVVSYQESSGLGPNACSLPRTVSESVECRAELEFLRNEDVKQRVCDYIPTATLIVDNFSTGEVYVSAGGIDRDGTVSVQLIIDGVVQSSNSRLLHGDVGDKFFVESIATDDDGYVSRRAEWATIKYTGSINPFPG